MLDIKNLNQYYGESHTLWDVNLSVAKGVCTCLMGRNGAGKTTLLKSIMGLLPVKDGSIHLEGTNLTNRPTHLRVRCGIGYVPQGREIFPRLTVEENLRLGFSIEQSKEKEIPKRIFDLFPILKDMLKRPGGNLSGGQQQQLAIGRVMVGKPGLLILDEPTEGIQPNLVHQIGDIILRLTEQEKITVLLVEQKLGFARRVAQHFCIMDRGRSVATGSIGDLNDQLIDKHLRV